MNPVAQGLRDFPKALGRPRGTVFAGTCAGICGEEIDDVNRSECLEDLYLPVHHQVHRARFRRAEVALRRSARKTPYNQSY